MNSEAERAFRAFHRVLVSIASTDLWRNDELRAGFALSFGPGIRVHSKDWPDLAKFRSLMMDFRQLLGNDESSNVNRVCNLVFKNRESDGWSEQEADRIAAARRRFTEALERPADYYSVPQGTARPTIRRLLDGWINGEWFHGDEDKREERIQRELDPLEDLSLALIIPAVREAILAAIDIDEVISAGPKRE
jgi:hypothetical protein